MDLLLTRSYSVIYLLFVERMSWRFYFFLNEHQIPENFDSIWFKD